MLKAKFQTEAKKIGKALEEARNVLIIAHKNPDGDTTGAALALEEHLRSQNRQATVFAVDPFPENLLFLPNVDDLAHEFNLNDFDLAFCLDAGADYMTGLKESHPALFGGKFPLVNIDHHPTNDNFGKWNIVDDEAASTTLLLAELFQFLEIKVSHRMATCLLCGLYTDTGSFQHSNTDPRALRIAAFLLRQGAALKQIAKNIFRTNRVSAMQLWGRVLSRVYQDADGVTISHISDVDFAETDTDPADLSGVIDYLNAVPDAKFSMLLTEKDGKVKASFRTLRADIDVAKIAGYFGGGGHTKAAGFSLPGRLQQEVRWKIVQD